METSRLNREPGHTSWHCVSDNLPTLCFVMMISFKIHRELIIKLAVTIAFASVGFLSVPALAQENGTTDSPQAPSITKMAPAGPITVAARGTSSVLPALTVLQRGARRQTQAG
jgi:hypothetical protein